VLRLLCPVNDGRGQLDALKACASNLAWHEPWGEDKRFYDGIAALPLGRSYAARLKDHTELSFTPFYDSDGHPLQDAVAPAPHPNLDRRPAPERCQVAGNERPMPPASRPSASCIFMKAASFGSDIGVVPTSGARPFDADAGVTAFGYRLRHTTLRTPPSARPPVSAVVRLRSPACLLSSDFLQSSSPEPYIELGSRQPDLSPRRSSRRHRWRQ